MNAGRTRSGPAERMPVGPHPDAATAQSVWDLYPAVAALPQAQSEALMARAAVVDLPADALVFDERQPCTGFPLVLSGAIRVVKAAPNGRELLLYRVSPGETCVLTTGCLLGRSDYGARGVTEAPTRLAVVPGAVFRQLLDEPAFRDFVFTAFNDRLADTLALVEEVAFRRLDERLAEHLLGRGNPVRSTHQQLADELGSVREIVTRILQGFRARGWVALAREEVRILDAAALRAHARGGSPTIPPRR